MPKMATMGPPANKLPTAAASNILCPSLEHRLMSYKTQRAVRSPCRIRDHSSKEEDEGQSRDSTERAQAGSFLCPEQMPLTHLTHGLFFNIL